MTTGDVKVNLKGLRKFKRQMGDFSRGPIAKAIGQWAYIYRTFAFRRFDKASKGDGTWLPLSPVTLGARRKGKFRITKSRGDEDRRYKKRQVAILRNLGLLYTALTPQFTGQPGAIEQKIPFGVMVGYGGPAGHKGGHATIADIASFHQSGGGRLPKREIIVNPDADAINQMSAVMQKAVNDLANEP